MIRHKNDITFIGTCTYIMACLLNTVAIFFTLILYNLNALPYLVYCLITIVVWILRITPVDNLPLPGPEISVFLFFLFVVLPMNFIPYLFSNMLEAVTDKYIMHKDYHLKKRNRSGYQVTKRDLILIYFLKKFISYMCLLLQLYVPLLEQSRLYF